MEPLLTYIVNTRIVLSADLVKDQSSTFKTHLRPKVGTDGSSIRTTVNETYREHSRSIDGHRNVLLRQQ